MTDLIKFANTDFHFNYLDKVEYHKIAKRELRRIAKALGLQKENYQVRDSMGGDAVAGEVILHSDKFYVQIGEKFSGHGLHILYRTCKGLKDYCGGTNRYADVSKLLSEEFQDALKSMMVN